MTNKRKHYGVNVKTFVEVWEDSQTTAEFSRRTGIPPRVAAARASLYRHKYNINLKVMPRTNSRKITTKDMNALIQQRRDKLMAENTRLVEVKVSADATA